MVTRYGSIATNSYSYANPSTADVDNFDYAGLNNKSSSGVSDYNDPDYGKHTFDTQEMIDYLNNEKDLKVMNIEEIEALKIYGGVVNKIFMMTGDKQILNHFTSYQGHTDDVWHIKPLQMLAFIVINRLTSNVNGVIANDAYLEIYYNLDSNRYWNINPPNLDAFKVGYYENMPYNFTYQDIKIFARNESEKTIWIQKLPPPIVFGDLWPSNTVVKTRFDFSVTPSFENYMYGFVG